METFNGARDWLYAHVRVLLSPSAQSAFKLDVLLSTEEIAPDELSRG